MTHKHKNSKIGNASLLTTKDEDFIPMGMSYLLMQNGFRGGHPPPIIDREFVLRFMRYHPSKPAPISAIVDHRRFDLLEFFDKHRLDILNSFEINYQLDTLFGLAVKKRMKDVVAWFASRHRPRIDWRADPSSFTNTEDNEFIMGAVGMPIPMDYPVTADFVDRLVDFLEKRDAARMMAMVVSCGQGNYEVVRKTGTNNAARFFRITTEIGKKTTNLKMSLETQMLICNQTAYFMGSAKKIADSDVAKGMKDLNLKEKRKEKPKEVISLLSSDEEEDEPTGTKKRRTNGIFVAQPLDNYDELQREKK
jgi:hypothetical protein